MRSYIAMSNFTLYNYNIITDYHYYVYILAFGMRYVIYYKNEYSPKASIRSNTENIKVPSLMVPLFFILYMTMPFWIRDSSSVNQSLLG